MAPPEAPIRGHVLAVDDDIMIRELVRFGLESKGLTVTTAASGAEAIAILEAEAIDLVISDIMMPGMDGFGLVTKLRANPHTRTVPVIFLTSRIDPTNTATGLRLSAEDFIRKPFDIGMLGDRVSSLLRREPKDLAQLLAIPDDVILTIPEFLDKVQSTPLERRLTHAVVAIDLDEREALQARFGPLADRDLGARLMSILSVDRDQPVVGRDEAGRLFVLIQEPTIAAVEARLNGLAQSIAQQRFAVAGERVNVTPSVGWTLLAADTKPSLAVAQSFAASRAAQGHLDLQSVQWDPSFDAVAPGEKRASRLRSLAMRSRTAWQIAATSIIGMGLPLAVYMTLYQFGYDFTTWFYVGIVLALVITGLSIWIEGFNALDPERPPREPGAPPPPASAIIAAYLPNEAATIVATVESFLLVDYPQLQVIVAYNTPRGHLVERTLREIAARDSRLLPLRVDLSTSKAQNVNAALRHASGEFVGVFDADHHPDPESFHRAWRWLSNGWDVVQGHCVIRNGDATKVARTVAVEFEAIYAVAHPGRNRLHGFGVFGGSNGYWRTDLLRATRMHGFMLTEDIDSSLRVVMAGGKIANDPALISRELAPTTAGQLWNQRMRWAQGWFQVSRKHLFSGWKSPHLNLRQKLGMTFLLGWREVYPWISIQMIPLIIFLAWREGGVGQLSWIIALFVLTTLFTFTVGPGQVLFSHRLAVPEIRRRTVWFWHYLWISSLIYTECKNIVTRVAQFKELTGERQWKVTPRTAAPKEKRP